MDDDVQKAIRELDKKVQGLTTAVEELHRLCIEISWLCKGYDVYKDNNGHVEFVEKKRREDGSCYL
jgi:hypothetical protein